MISSLYVCCALSRVRWHFLSFFMWDITKCKHDAAINVKQILRLWVEALCFVLSHNTWQNNFAAVKPTPFFLCLASSDRPRFSRFQKKLRRRQWHVFSNNFYFNLKRKQFLPSRALVFSLFSFDSNKEVDFSFLRCRPVDFVTTPYCFQALMLRYQAS